MLFVATIKIHIIIYYLKNTGHLDQGYLKETIMHKKILTLDNEMEAYRIKDILDAEGIPHILRSYHDTAYDGLFQGQYGWGALEADEAYEERILELIDRSNSEK